jgi:RNA polymerase sigma factor (sigma-70 family)
VDLGNAPFESFVGVEGERLRRALIAAYGVDTGTEACAEALAWAWEHWDRVVAMANPVGYLFRVGQSSTRRLRRWRRPVHLPTERAHGGDGEMSLRVDEVLLTLPRRQRLAALLIHGYGYSYAEVADITGSSVASVRNDLHRAMKTLRKRLEVP